MRARNPIARQSSIKFSSLFRYSIGFIKNLASSIDNRVSNEFSLGGFDLWVADSVIGERCGSGQQPAHVTAGLAVGDAILEEQAVETGMAK
jgi:hypothetical protein